ncbi:MAG TPA: ANTAR domain-containing protein, partial [Streptosporangiaceae bacterium]|nr:ANTAR domain-containing protein [Streptosporangiaceae bacterium]
CLYCSRSAPSAMVYSHELSGAAVLDSRFDNLYAAARTARTRAEQAVRRTECVLEQSEAALQQHQQARAQARLTRELRQSGRGDRLRYSPYARLEARLASMPVIEQAKGILMAQCGCSADRAFDALRRISQHENIRVRDLAAQVVANTAPAQEPANRVPVRRAERAVLFSLGTRVPSAR